MRLDIHHFDGGRELHRKFDDLFTLIRQLPTKGYLMSAMDDLKAALTELVNEAVTDVEALIVKLAAADNVTDAMALVQQAHDATAKLRADMAVILAPAPAPEPEPPPTQLEVEPTPSG